MYPHRAKRNPRPMVPRSPPPSPADADDGSGLSEAERLRVLRWRLEEMGARQEREQMQQVPIDPRLLADTYRTPNSCVVPGTQDTTSGLRGDSGGYSVAGFGGYAAVGNEVSPAGTGGWGLPAGDGELPVGGGYPCVGDGHSPAVGFDFVFQAGGGPVYPPDGSQFQDSARREYTLRVRSLETEREGTQRLISRE